MSDGSIVGALWQTLMTLRRELKTRHCPWCLSRNRKATLKHVVTERGYVRRCWQCGGEYDSDGRKVWP